MCFPPDRPRRTPPPTRPDAFRIDVSPHQPTHPTPQRQDSFLLKPRVLRQPQVVARRRVRQRNTRRQQPNPVPHRIRQRRVPVRQIPLERIPPRVHRQLHTHESREQPIVPQRRTLAPGPQITRPPRPGKAEPHGHQRHPRRVIKLVVRDSQPISQSQPAAIVPRDPARVRRRSGRLPDDQHPRRGRPLDQRAAPPGQLGRTRPARPYLLHQLRQSHRVFLHRKAPRRALTPRGRSHTQPDTLPQCLFAFSTNSWSSP